MAQTKKEKTIFYGWWVVTALSVVAFFGPMGRYILTPLFPFLEIEMGWSREAVGLAFSIHLWTYALLAVLAGRMVDVVGGRTTICIGGALLLVSLVLLSMAERLWHVYLIFGILLAFGVSMTHFVPNTSIVRKWFVKRAATATGLVIVGTSLGFGVLMPVVAHFSACWGWRTTVLTCGVLFGSIIMFLALLVIRSTPESMGLYPDGLPPNESEGNSDDTEDPRGSGKGSHYRTLRSKDFWTLFLAYSVMGIPLQGLLAHIVMWGVDLGADPSRAGLFIAVMTLPSIPVRVLGGWMGDRWGKRRILILFNLFCVLIWAAGWFSIKGMGAFVIFILILGFAYSAPFSLYPPFVGDLFGRGFVGTLMGALTLGHGIIGGTGPLIWGWVVDRTHAYRAICPLSALCYAFVVICLLLTKSDAPDG